MTKASKKASKTKPKRKPRECYVAFRWAGFNYSRSNAFIVEPGNVRWFREHRAPDYEIVKFREVT